MTIIIIIIGNISLLQMFPEVYVMDGGYKAFFEKYPHLCTPQTYVTMFDDKFQGAFN